MKWALLTTNRTLSTCLRSDNLSKFCLCIDWCVFLDWLLSLSIDFKIQTYSTLVISCYVFNDRMHLNQIHEISASAVRVLSNIMICSYLTYLSNTRTKIDNRSNEMVFQMLQSWASFVYSRLCGFEEKTIDVITQLLKSKFLALVWIQ